MVGDAALNSQREEMQARDMGSNDQMVGQECNATQEQMNILDAPLLSTGQPVRKLARGVLVTRFFPMDPEASKTGIYQRLKLMIDAMQSACEVLEVVFLLGPDVESDPQEQARLCDLAKRWIGDTACRISVRVVARQQLASSTSLWGRYGPGIRSVFNQVPYSGYVAGRPLQVLEEILASDPDILFCHQLESAIPLLRLERPPKRLIVDLNDVEHVSLWRRMLRSPEWPSERLRLLHTPALAIGEYRVAKLARHVLVCSDTDANYLNRLWGKTKAVDVPNAVHLPKLASTESSALNAALEKPVCLFLGTYNYGPNLDAATHMALAVWPFVQKHCPSAELWLAGPGSERLPSGIREMRNVRITGFVEDLDALYRRATVVCSPIRAGSGTRIKILEAAAHGKAIVSTRIGAEGIDLVPGESIEIADSVAQFAKHCIELLRDEKRRLELGNRARELIMARYEYSAILNRLVSAIVN